MRRNFFLDRPIFAAVCSIVIFLVGLVTIPTLPIAQYPQIAPPVVSVSANYTGANAQAVEASVTTPLEEAINGVQGLRYISSTSGNDGSSNITATFNLGTNLDIAATDVQNAIAQANGRLPNEVKQTGISVNKNSGSFVMAIAIWSKDPRWDQQALSNFVSLNLVNTLKRVQGVGDVRLFGERKYAMRLWLDPAKLANQDLTAGDVVTALQEQNVQIPAGSIGSAPESSNQPYTYSISAQGRLKDPQQFANVILRATPDGGLVRVGDVGRVELGAESYSTDLRFNNNRAVGLGILQLPTANALSVSEGVRKVLDTAPWPAGVEHRVAFDSTSFVKESINEVIVTLVIAIVLVILTIFIFLQDWRTTLIPAITIPISLVGTFAVMKLLGFSINTLTLFGLTLATGLVVDDAIVVIENIARYIQEKRAPAYEGTVDAMREITGAVVATSLVLLAVFVPVAFFPGTAGQLYKQFALTIAISIAFSAFVALTLTPALSQRLIGVRAERPNAFFRAFNRGFDRLRTWYDRVLPRLFAWRFGVVVLFLIGLAVTAFLFKTTPTGFIPTEDQGYFIMQVQAPEGTSLAKEQQISHRVTEMMLKNFPDIVGVFDVGGFAFTGAAPNYGLMFGQLKPWNERKRPDQQLGAILQRLQFALFQTPGAQIFAFPPPAIQGVGNFGGFQFEILNNGNLPLTDMMKAAGGFMYLGNQPGSGLSQVFTTFRVNSPQLAVDIDRDKAKSLGVPITTLVNTLQIYLGSQYVNDFTYQARSYRVYVQADAPFRSRIPDLQQIYVRSSSGGTIPVTNLVTYHMAESSPVINHYNLFRSVEMNGSPAPGVGSGTAIQKMQALAKQILPPGMSYAWTGTTLDEIESGGRSALVFALGIVFVFLVLSAQYESFIDPFIILLAVPLAIFGALAAIMLRGLVSDVYSQVGFVMLVGLASKNAILIVEFANQLRAEGKSIEDAAREAAETRLRPILMTSFAFILGVVPLVFASGAGSAARHSLGTTVFGGMIVSTILNLFLIPVMYVIVARFDRRHVTPPDAPQDGTAGGSGRLSDGATATQPVPAT